MPPRSSFVDPLDWVLHNWSNSVNNDEPRHRMPFHRPTTRRSCWHSRATDKSGELNPVSMTRNTSGLPDNLWSLADTKREDALWYWSDWSGHLCLAHYWFLVEGFLGEWSSFLPAHFSRSTCSHIFLLESSKRSFRSTGWSIRTSWNWRRTVRASVTCHWTLIPRTRMQKKSIETRDIIRVTHPYYFCHSSWFISCRIVEN